MRILLIPVLATLALPTVAEAQRGSPRIAPPTASRWHGGERPRWGYRFDRRWAGGWRAPGGWSAYRMPVRGWAVPRYWIAPTFVIDDFGAYGLAAPAPGYRWYRYYDDAVLVDPYGRAYDSVRGIDWDRGGDAYYDYNGDYRPDLDEQGYYDREYETRRRGGVGGAIAGGAIGAAAGAVIAGRGNRVPGAIIGGGVGAVAGAALDRRRDASRDEDRGAPYPMPSMERDPTIYAPPSEVVQSTPGSRRPPITNDRDEDDDYREEVIRTVRREDGGTTSYYPDRTVTVTDGYVADGWYYPPSTTTVVRVTQRPVVTITTSEEVVRYRRPVRRAARR